MSKRGGKSIRFVIVTRNLGKVREFCETFSEKSLVFRVEPFETPEIQSMNLKEIAEKSALYAYGMLSEPVMVEDAGLFIEALNGFPGPFSSYVFKTIGVKGILDLMKEVENRRAKFVSVIAFYSPIIDSVKFFIGEVEGSVSKEPRGEKGFGFDPIFIPAEGDGRAFAEMDVKEKNRLSHRARAAEKFAKWLFEEYAKKVTLAYE